MANSKPFLVKNGLQPQTDNNTDIGASGKKFLNAYISNLAGSVSINNAYTFPTADGPAGYALKTDGAGNLSFDPIGSIAYGDTPPSSPAQGDAWFDSGTTGELYVYTGTEWISTTPASEASFLQQYYTGDGTTTAFNTGAGVDITFLVFLNGVLLRDPADYSVTNGIINFVQAPLNGDSIDVVLTGQVDSIGLNLLGIANHELITVDSSGNVTLQGDLNLGTNTINNVVDPVNPQDAATKAYVDAQITAQDLDIAGDTGTGAVDLDSQIFTIAGTANEIETTVSGQTVTVGLPADVIIGNDLTVSGNLTVSGTSYIVNTTSYTVTDPIISIGGSGPLSIDDNKDRGVEFYWHDGTNPFNGFFGFDDSTGAFTFIPDATFTSEVVTGTPGSVVFGSATLADATVNDIQIGVTSPNEIDTTTGNLILDSASGTTSVDDNLVVVGNLTVNGTQATLPSAVISDLTDNRIVLAGTAGALEDDANLTFDGTTLTVGVSTINQSTGATSIGGTLDVTGDTNINSLSGSSSTTTGALVVDGGVGIAQNAYIGGNADITGSANVRSTTGSTSSSTGALIVAGGAGIAQNLYVGGNVDVTGNVTIAGNLTFGDSDTDSITLNADVTSNIIPNVNDTYDLGTTTKAWRDLYLTESISFEGATGDHEIVLTTNLTDALSVRDSAGDLMVFSTISGSNSISITPPTILSTSLQIAGTTTINQILDEDNMISNSNSALATQQSIKAYVDAQVTAQDLDLIADTGTGAVDLDSQSLTIAGTANEIETVASGQTVTIGLPANVSIASGLTINSTTTVTQILDEDNFNSNSATALATQQSIKAYVDAQVTAQALDIAGDTGSGSVDLDSQVFTIAGTANEVETTVSGQTVTVGLPADVTVANNLTVTNQATVNGSAVLTTANEGSGNGLDADTVDGNHYADIIAEATALAIALG